MGRYFPRSERHGVGNPRPGGIPTNINIADNSHLGTTGNSPAAANNVNNNPNNNNPPHIISLSPESLSLAHLRQKSISHPMQQCQLTIYVPPHTVGAVIGRGGRTILNVQREAMRRSAGHVSPVRISVLGSNSNISQATNNNANNAPANQHEGVGDNQGDSFPTSQGGQPSSSSTWNYHEYYNSLNQKQQPQNQPSDDTTDDSTTNDDDDWTPVIIRGDPVGCFSAVRQILPLVDRDNDPNIVLEVPIHRAKHNMLVGKGGITIAALSATFETRIMIPPNEFMSNVGGGENFWKQRQAHNDAGSAMLFGDGGGGGNHAMMNPNANNATAQPGTLPPNIIQLEGEIDNVELCLVKMLSIVAGERWIPTGAIVENLVEKAEVKISVSKGAPNTSSDGSASAPSTSGKGKEGGTTAEAVIIKIWTPTSKLLNLGKIRKVQRKTNTIIRRKKLRLSSNLVDGSGGALVSEREEEVEEEADEPPLGNEGENDEEDDIPKEVFFSGPKTATKYIITGKTEAVLSATAQFEKILGLEPGSSPITDTTNKTNSITTDGGSSANNKDAIGQAGAKSEGEYENIGGGGGPGGKKMRRKKKRGKGGGINTPRNSKDGPPPMVAERGDV